MAMTRAGGVGVISDRGFVALVVVISIVIICCSIGGCL